jgi:sugar lactone lactonase YvrE
VKFLTSLVLLTLSVSFAGAQLAAKSPEVQTGVRTITHLKKKVVISKQTEHVKVTTQHASAAFLEQRKRFADAANSASTSGNPAVPALSATTRPRYGGPSSTIVDSQSFGSVNTGGQSTTKTFTYVLPAGDTNLAFTTTAGVNFSILSSSCAVSQCTVQVAFAPKNPGLLTDALSAKDSSGNLVYQTFLSGNGTGPQFGFMFGYETDYYDIASYPTGSAWGPDGTFYVMDGSNGTVSRIVYGGSVTSFQIKNLCNPSGIAVDGAGTVYVADPTFNQVVAYSSDGVQTVLQTTPLSNPTWVAVDGAGALYISDTGNGRIIKLDNHNVESTVLSGVNAPAGIAIDSSGNVYFADQDNGGQIREWSAITQQVTTLGDSFGNMQGISLDAAGDVYYVTTELFGVFDQSTGDTYTEDRDDNGPFSIAVSPNGNIVSTQARDGYFRLRDVSSGNFGLETQIQQTATGTLTIENTGNSALAFSALGIGGPAYRIDPSTVCNTNAGLPPGNACVATLDFTPPTIGSNYNDTFTATTNSLNVSGTQNKFSLFGTGDGANTNTSLSISPQSAALGANVTFTAAVVSYGNNGLPSPTGSVNFFDGDSQLGSTNLDGGSATFSTNSLSAGNHTVMAFYVGDSANNPSSSYMNQVTVGIGSGNPTINLTASSANINLNQPETLTVTVTASGATPTGTATFRDNGSLLGEATISASGSSATASITVSNLAGGRHSIVVDYSGDPNYAENISNTQQVTVAQGTSATTLSISPSSPTTEQTVTLTATVQSGTNPAESGLVIFSDQFGTIGYGNIQTTDTGGTASYTTNLSAGSHQVIANYTQDASYADSISASQTVIVSQGTPYLNLNVSASSIKPSQTEILELQLGHSDVFGENGTVTFSDQNGTLGTGVACGCYSGNFSILQLTNLSPGVHYITGTYNGDSNYSAATSSPQTVTVSGASGSPTTTALSVSSSSINFGNTETLTATVQGGTSPAETGTVTFADQNGTLGSVAVSASSTGSTAILSLTTLSVGTHQITATYSGDSNYGSSVSASQSVTVSGGSTAVPTNTTLGVSSASTTLGTPEIFTATVTGNGSAPTGSVTFSDQNGTIISADLVRGDTTSTARATYSGLTFGSHQIVATYIGGTNYASSSSPAQTVTVGPATSTTSLTVAPATTTAGQSVTLSGSVQSYPNPALNGVISFADQNGPLGFTNITPNSTGGTASLTVTNLSVGVHQITAAYNNDYQHASSISPAQTVTISAASATVTTTTLVVTSSTVYKSPITLRASVTPASGTSVPAGQVIFCDASAPRCAPELSLATAQVNANGNANIHLAAGTIGTHSYIARFLGITSLAGSTSPSQTVSVTGTYPSTAIITSSGSPGNYSLTGTVVGLGSRTLTPTGTVTFNDTTNTANPALGNPTLVSGTLGFNAVPATGSPNKTGAGSYGVASGDFNGDGFMDVAVENYIANTVSVLLGNGDGTFQPQVSYAVGTSPERVLVADFNGDGVLDLVVANTGSNNLSVLLGNGDGTFKTQATYAAASPVGLGVMDLNHDGFADIVAGDYYSNTMSVLLGNGDGTFKTSVAYPTGGTPQTLAEGDFNGDGNVDIAVGNFGDNTVGIFLGNGDGTFQSQITYAVGRAPQGVQVGDFNADGFDDIAVSNSTDNTISILLGNGDGTFKSQVTYPVGADPVGLVIADFNGDGKQDISVGNTAQSALTQSILLGNGDGTFQPQLTFKTGNFPYGEVAADFNGDGFPDLAISNFSDATATILLSQVTETVSGTVTGVSVGAPSGTHNINASYAGDLNFSASTSSSIPLTNATLPATTTSLSVTPSSQNVGQPITFNASVSSPSSTVAPTGTVTFTYTGTTSGTLGTASLQSGVASLSSNALPLGTYSVTAAYSGSTSFAASISTAQSVTVISSAPVVDAKAFGSVPLAGAPGTITLTYSSSPGATGITATLAQGTVFKSQALSCVNGPPTQVPPFPSGVCSLQITFTPTYPGLATDALTINDANGNLLYKTFLSGIGTAPQLGYNLAYGIFNTFSGTIKSPASVALGPDGNLYVGDTSTNQVYKVTAGSFGGGTVLSIRALGKPAGIAVSGDGTLYVADQTNNVIRSFNIISSAQGTLTTSALITPTGVAVDGTGAIYISDAGHGRIIRIDNQGAETIVATGLTSPGGLALDATGNLFYADPNSGGEITEIPAGGGTPVSVGKNLGAVGDIAVAPSGRMYFATTKSVSSILNGTVYSNGYFNLSGNAANTGLALDRFQDVITTNTTGGVLAVTNRTGSSFTFGTPVGTTNTCCDSIENTGNSPLTVAAVVNNGANYALHVGGGECVAGQVLQPTQTCNVVVDFSPTAFQNYPDTVTVTSNSLNIAGSTNTSSLLETGQQIPTTVAVTVSPNPARAGQPVTFAATLAFTSTYATAPSGTMKFLNADGSTLASVPVTGLTTQYTTSALTAGAYGVTASYSGDTAFVASTSAAQSYTITLSAPTLAAVSPSTGALGSAATTVTLAGTNFTTGDIVRLNGTTISSTYVSATSLTAVIPASFFVQAGTGLLTVFDPTSQTTTGSVMFTVTNAPQIVFTGPSTSTSGAQPTLTFQLVNPYPIPLAGALNLSFVPVASAGVNDPAVQFATGGRTLAFNIPANSTLTPAVQLQTGTVAGTATITLAVTANGVNVTPASVAPVVITIPPAVPTITSTSVTRSGNMLTVTLVGFSNTRETTKATFHFTPIAGATINNPDVTVTVTPTFASYYSGATSLNYGSAFTYMQPFTLDQDAAIVQNVTVTLANTVGTSATATTP